MLDPREAYLMAGQAARIGVATGQCDKGQLMCIWIKQRCLRGAACNTAAGGKYTHTIWGSVFLHPGQANKAIVGECRVTGCTEAAPAFALIL